LLTAIKGDRIFTFEGSLVNCRYMVVDDGWITSACCLRKPGSYRLSGLTKKFYIGMVKL